MADAFDLRKLLDSQWGKLGKRKTATTLSETAPSQEDIASSSTLKTEARKESSMPEASPVAVEALAAASVVSSSGSALSAFADRPLTLEGTQGLTLAAPAKSPASTEATQAEPTRGSQLDAEVARIPTLEASQASLPGRAPSISNGESTAGLFAEQAGGGDELRKMLDLGWKKAAGSKRKATSVDEVVATGAEDGTKPTPKDDPSGTSRAGAVHGEPEVVPATSSRVSSAFLARVLGRMGSASGGSSLPTLSDTSSIKLPDSDGTKDMPEIDELPQSDSELSPPLHEPLAKVAKSSQSLRPASKAASSLHQSPMKKVAKSSQPLKPASKASGATRPTATKAPQPMTVRSMGRTLDLKSRVITPGMSPPPASLALKRMSSGNLGAIPKMRAVAKHAVFFR